MGQWYGQGKRQNSEEKLSQRNVVRQKNLTSTKLRSNPILRVPDASN